MFSTNPLTRRRQLLVTALSATSGIFLALLLLAALRQPRPRPHLAERPAAPVQRYFSKLATSPDGTLQAELYGPRVVVRETATQKPVTVYKGKIPLKGLRFNEFGSLEVRFFERGAVVGGLPQLNERLLLINPATGQAERTE
jgi:hypothetical protein